MGTALLLPVPQPTASRTSGAWQQRPVRLPSRALLVQCQAAPGEEAAAGGPQSTTAPAPRQEACCDLLFSGPTQLA